MLRGEVLDVTSKNKYTVSFFEDDSIDIVRQKIGAALDIHPDRLFILVGEKFAGDYYKNDPRHWEALFRRLSYDGSPLEQTVFQEYQLQYRTPNTTVGFRPYDKIEWMSKPDSVAPLVEGPEFIEYRILGVEEVKSYVLPMTVNAQLTSRIQATELPIPEVSSLFVSLHNPANFVRFMVRPYDDTAEAALPVYYPFLRSTTPPRLTEESVRLLGKNAKLLDDLLKMESPEPKEVTILRARFYIPFVDTDLGSAVRTRFEQIFYGLTVSKETPYIGYFTAKDQISRHKFYTEDPKSKKPFVNMDNWASWWSVKPARNIPTLILFRGETKTHFDRVAITASDIVVTTYRQEGNTETIEELKKSAFKWLSTFDAVTPFLEESDTKLCRWELQDLSFLAKYSGKLEEFDLMRFNCISSIFDIADKTKTQFTLLRTDNTNNGLSAVEVKVLQMMKDGNAKPEAIAEELSIPLQNARELIVQVESRIDEDPRLGDKSLRGYPTLRVGAESVIVSSVNSLDRALKYSNLLRYILSSPDSSDIDAICPKRMERVTVDTSVVPSTTLNVDAAIAEEYADLFGEFEGEEELEPEEEKTEELPEEVQRISTKSDRGSTYNYFKSRLQKFDPETFDPEGSLYPKKCEQKHQPIILSEADKNRLNGTPYDASEYLEEKKKVDVVEPEGTIVCPEYWCMKDQIPLRDDQLDKEKGEIKCPACHGKLQTKNTDNPREYPLIKRETGFLYPGFVDYNAPKNGKPMPCCFKKPRSEKTLKETDDKYYILGETKVGTKPLRVAFLTPQLINLLRITEDYSVLDGSRRLQNGMSAFFRTILLNSSETLPTCLGLKTKIPPPRENLSTVLKCSFLRSWKTSGTKHVKEIENKLGDICPYKVNETVREELAKIIAGIDEAFEAKKMSRLEELEYSALALNCDVFRIYTESNTLGCMFYAPMVRARTRAVIILQNGSEFDILSHVTRLPRGFVYQSNIFQVPFKKETYALLERLRNQACATEIPSFDQALNVMQQIGSDDFSVIMDPFGQGQALFVKNKIVLPFRNTPLPNVIQHKLLGYKSIDKEDLPKRDELLHLLEQATKFSKGYTYKEDLYNAEGQVVELLLESGLRIPVQPIQKSVSEPLEVIETVATEGESVLTFGKPSTELRETQKSISYSEEVFQFLLFQLTKDIQTDYRELREALQEVRPKQPDVQPLLQKWFTDTTQFVNIKESTDFISKIRTPCGQFKSKDSCSGNLCGWDGKVCRIQIKPSIQKDRLFHRLLSTLVENSKIRAVVLDGHTTPFFSTILYVELPHEVIMTDTELP